MKNIIYKLFIISIALLVISTSPVYAKGTSAASHASTSHTTTSKSSPSSAKTNTSKSTSKNSTSKTSNKINLAKANTTTKSITSTKIAKNNYQAYNNTNDYNRYTRNYFHNNSNIYYGYAPYHSDFLYDYYMFRTLSPYQRVYCYNDIDYTDDDSVIIIFAIIIAIGYTLFNF